MVASDGKEILDLPSGYYFDPTDDIAMHYLKQKILGRDLPADIIPTIHDLYTCNPINIPFDEFRYGPPDCWWFFTSRLHNDESVGGAGPSNDDSNVEGIGHWRTIQISRIDYEGENIGCKKTRIFSYDNPESSIRINDLVIQHLMTYEFIAKEAAFESQDLTDNVKQQMEHIVLCKVCNIETLEGLFLANSTEYKAVD